MSEELEENRQETPDMPENDENQDTAAENTAVSDEKEKVKKPLWREILEWVVAIVAAVAVAFVIRAFIFEPVKVDGHSMCETLQDGEIMLVTKYQYTELFGTPIFGEPKRDDVVICHYPGRGSTNFVKRVVGLPGDVIDIVDGYTYVNGEKLDEPFIEHRDNHNFKGYKVPEGHYFVMGDNRANSNDSRAQGAIARNMIVGHARLVVFPFSQWKVIE